MAQTIKQDRRKNRKHVKLDPDKVKELHKQGLGLTDIAKHQGVNPSTVWRFLEKIKPENKALQDYKDNRADILAYIQGKGINIINMVLDTFDQDTISAMSGQQKNGLLMAANAIVGTRHQEERLERNLSTSNTSVITRLANEFKRSINANDND